MNDENNYLKTYNYDNKYIRKYDKCNFIASGDLGFEEYKKENYNKKIQLNKNNKFIAIVENIKLERKLKENNNLFFIDEKRRIGIDSRTEIIYLNKTILIGFDTEIDLIPINSNQSCFLTLLSNNPFDLYVLSKKQINSQYLQKNLLIYSGKIDEEEETELMVF